MTGHAFDRLAFSQLLREATIAAFQGIQAHHGHEHLYSFALYTTGAYDYIIPTASTEEGLDYVTQRYMTKSAHPAWDVTTQRLSLRWSACDSPLHDQYSQSFEPINTMLWDVHEQYYELHDQDESDHALLAHLETILQDIPTIMLETLRHLDEEGVFGRGTARTSLTLNILMGDQSDAAKIANAQYVNPPAIWQSLEQELAARSNLW